MHDYDNVDICKDDLKHALLQPAAEIIDIITMHCFAWKSLQSHFNKIHYTMPFSQFRFVELVDQRNVESVDR